jgi:hypothetical protein
MFACDEQSSIYHVSSPTNPTDNRLTIRVSAEPEGEVGDADYTLYKSKERRGSEAEVLR